MASLNRIVIVGKLLSEPEARFTVEGLPITKFAASIASESTGNSGKIEVVCFRKIAEVCGQYLRAGSTVIVEGRIQNRSFEDQSGNRQWATEVIASNVQFIDAVSGKPIPTVGADPHADQVHDAAVRSGTSHVGTSHATSVQDASGFEDVEELSDADLPF